MNRRDFLLYSSAITTTSLSAGLLYDADIVLTPAQYSNLLVLDKKLVKIKRHVGFANFNLISYDYSLKIARMNSYIGAFSKEEIELMQMFFYESPKKYGFYGVKTCNDINNEIAKKDVVKIPHTGHYVYKGLAHKDYNRIISDVGDTVYLTSGVRNVMKQMSLYVNKLKRVRGNITQASRDIAPPSHSFHTIGDFDIGKMGLGRKNFTSAFAKTSEFKEIIKLDYISIRYSHNNTDGVRYEPWHVKII